MHFADLDAKTGRQIERDIDRYLEGLNPILRDTIRSNKKTGKKGKIDDSDLEQIVKDYLFDSERLKKR